MRRKLKKDSPKSLPFKSRLLTDKEKAEAYVVKTNIDEGPQNSMWNRFMSGAEK